MGRLEIRKRNMANKNQKSIVAIGCEEKNKTESMNVFPYLKDKTKKAILNAKKVENYQIRNEKDLNNENCNPYTGVYKVVEELAERNRRI